jgi:hypothetical protein
MFAGVASTFNMAIHLSKKASDARIQSRIRSRIFLNWPIKFLALCFLVCMVGFDSYYNKDSMLRLVAFASELEDTTTADEELESSITSKVPAVKECAIQKPPMTMNRILIKAGKRGFDGGLPGAIAGVIQVLTLMWIRCVSYSKVWNNMALACITILTHVSLSLSVCNRTVVNYQSHYGASFYQAVLTLMNNGGIPRLYRGLSVALVQAPLARFVSSGANDGVEVFMANWWQPTQSCWGPGRTTVVAGFVLGLWRVLLVLIDTCKTVLQIDSVEGFRQLMRRVKAGKIGVLLY